MNSTFESRLEILSNEAEASIGLNPFFQWAKFILTDDDVNLNGNKVPSSEFDNIIATGLYTPLKMDFNKISKGHADAEKKPIGVITHIKKDVVDSKNCLVALAALWKKERPGDVELLQKMINENNPPKVSWELYYHELDMEGNAEVLKGVILTGVSIVSNPAYADRARFLQMAELEYDESEKWTRKYINDLPDSAFLYIEPGGNKDADGKTVPRSLRHLPYKDMDGKVDLDHLRNAIARLGQPNTGEGWLTESLRKELLDKAQKLLQKEEKSEMNEDFQEKISQYEQLIKSQTEELEKVKSELEELRKYKEEVEAEKLAEQRIKQIKQMFLDKGINKPEEYFERSKEVLLGLSDSALDFMIQELVAFAENAKEKQASTDPKIPNINDFSDGKTEKLNPAVLAKLLKQL